MPLPGCRGAAWDVPCKQFDVLPGRIREAEPACLDKVQDSGSGWVYTPCALQNPWLRVVLLEHEHWSWGFTAGRQTLSWTGEVV